MVFEAPEDDIVIHGVVDDLASAGTQCGGIDDGRVVVCALHTVHAILLVEHLFGLVASVCICEQ